MVCLGSYLENGFECLARGIARHAWKVIIVCLLVDILLGVGLIKINIRGDVDQLYIPYNSQTRKTRSSLQMYPDRSGENFYPHSSIDVPLFSEIIVSAKDPNSSLLSPTHKSEVEHAVNFIKNITIEDGGQSISYYDRCALRNGICVVTCQFYVNQQPFDFSDFGTLEINQPAENSTTISSDPDPIRMKVRFFLRQNGTEEGALSRLWIEEFLSKMEKYESPSLSIVYAQVFSLNAEIDKDTTRMDPKSYKPMDINLFGSGFIILITLASFLSAGGDCVSKRVHISRVGITLGPVAMAAAFGLLCVIGVDFVAFIGVMPFVAMCHALNNLLCSLSSLSDCTGYGDPVERVGKTVRSTGVPMTITFITNVASYGLGYFMSELPLMRIICAYSGVTYLLVYLNHIIFFTACLAIHERRIEDNRHCCTCKPIPTKDDPDLIGMSNCFICCCSGGPPSSREDTESRIERLTRRIFARLVLLRWFGWFLLLAFVCYIAASVIGCMHIRADTFREDSVYKGSYFHKFTKVNSKYFPHEKYISFVSLVPPTQAGSSSLSELLTTIQTDAKTHPLVDDRYQSCVDIFKDAGIFKNFSMLNSNFPQELLQSSQGCENDITFTTGGKMVSSRTFVKSVGLMSNLEYINLMSEMSDIAQTKAGYKTFVYSPEFVFQEAYFSLFWDTVYIIGARIAVPFILGIFLFPNPLLSIFNLGCTVSILGGVLGMMYFWNVLYTPIVMTIFILGGPYATEAAVHICYSFGIAKGVDRRSCVHTALVRTCCPLFNLTSGSMLGLLFLLMARSYVFISVFKVFLLYTAFTSAHVVFFLPLMLLMFGPYQSMRSFTTIFTSSVNKAVSDVKTGISTVIPGQASNGKEKKKHKKNKDKFLKNDFPTSKSNGILNPSFSGSKSDLNGGSYAPTYKQTSKY